MRATLSFFVFLCVCLVLGALLTYPLVLTGWFELEPARIMSRLTQVFILLGAWPFLRWCGTGDRVSLGYGVQRRAFLRALGLGWLIGVALLLVPALVLVFMVVLVPSPLTTWGQIASKVLQAMAAGFLIALLEETFFRGALWSAIRRHGGWVSAALGSATLYAIVHFMKPAGLPEGMTFDWSGALFMFIQVFVAGLDWQDLDSVATLFLAGLLLALVRERTGHIGWCIGLHAGWVWVIQMTRKVTDPNPESPLAFLVGGYDSFLGWLVLAWIAVVVVTYWRWGGAVTRGNGLSSTVE